MIGKLFVLMVLIVFSIAAMADPNLNQTQAIQIASHFCQAIGTTTTGVPTVAYLVPDETGTLNPAGALNVYYLPVWQVTFNEAEIRIDDVSMKVVRYSNYVNQLLKSSLSNQPAGQAVPQQAAIDTATAILQSAGWGTDLVFEGATLQQGDYPPTASMHSWFLVWCRMYQSLPFYEDCINVHIQAESGQFMGFSVAFSTPNPMSTTVILGRAQADSIANAMIVSQGIQNTVLDSVDICIVQPSNYWQARGTGANFIEQTGVSRVAYVYSISVPTISFNDGLPAYNDYTMYVDAQNGAVIGGEYAMLMDLPPAKIPKQTPVASLLESAKEVRLFRIGNKGSWSKTPIAVLSQQSKHDYFLLLQHTRRCKNTGPLALANYKIVVIGKAKARHELRYMPSTGRIGSGHEWGLVPTRFKSWVQSLEEQAGKKKVASVSSSPQKL